MQIFEESFHFPNKHKNVFPICTNPPLNFLIFCLFGSVDLAILFCGLDYNSQLFFLLAVKDFHNLSWRSIEMSSHNISFIFIQAKTVPNRNIIIFLQQKLKSLYMHAYGIKFIPRRKIMWHFFKTWEASMATKNQ